MNPKERLQGLRGEAYYDEFAAIMREYAESVLSQMDVIKDETGDFQVGDLVEIADAHGLPFKPLVLWMEKQKVVRDGMWEHLESLGFCLKATREYLAERKTEVTA